MARRSRKTLDSSDPSSSSSDSEDSARSRQQSEDSPDPAPEDSSSSSSDESSSSSSDESSSSSSDGNNTDDSDTSSIQSDKAKDGQVDPSPDDDSIEDQLREEDRGLDAKFTPSQLEHLLGLRERYRFASARERKEIAQQTGQEFRDDLIRQGQALTQLQTKNLFSHIKTWFSQRARTRREPVRWTVNWTARQVFYKQNMALVAATQRAMYEANTGKKPREGTAKVDLDLVDDDDNTSAVGVKGPSLFNFFQKALSAEWEQLLPEEKEKYEILATEWRTDGPSEEVRKALAEKEACRVIRFLAQDLYQQMGVRLFILANYEDSNDDVIAVSLDFNNELGSNGASYKLAAKSYLERVDLLNHYAAFAKKAVPQEGETVDRKATAKSMTFEVNARGEAILPDPNDKGKPLKDYVWYPSLVRRFMHFDWARAQGQPMRANNGPSWVNICDNVSKYIDPQYLPEGAEPLKDPGAYTLKNCKKLVFHWWDRQQRGLTAFQFRGYWDGVDFVERAEDESLPEDEASDFKLPTRKGKKATVSELKKPKKPNTGLKEGQRKATKKVQERPSVPPNPAKAGTSALMPISDLSMAAGTAKEKAVPKPRPTQRATHLAKAPSRSEEGSPLEVLSSGTQNRDPHLQSTSLVNATRDVTIDGDLPTTTIMPEGSKVITGVPLKNADPPKQSHKKKKHKRKEMLPQAGRISEDGERDGSKPVEEGTGKQRAGEQQKRRKATRSDDGMGKGESVASQEVEGQLDILPSEPNDRKAQKPRKEKAKAVDRNVDLDGSKEGTSVGGVSLSMGKEGRRIAASGDINPEHVDSTHVTLNLPHSATEPTIALPKGKKKKKTMVQEEGLDEVRDSAETGRGKEKEKGKGKRVRVATTTDPIEGSTAAFGEGYDVDEEAPNVIDQGSPQKQSAEDRDILSNANSGKYWQLTSATRRKRENPRYAGGL